MNPILSRFSFVTSHDERPVALPPGSTQAFVGQTPPDEGLMVLRMLSDFPTAHFGDLLVAIQAWRQRFGGPGSGFASIAEMGSDDGIIYLLGTAPEGEAWDSYLPRAIRLPLPHRLRLAHQITAAAAQLVQADPSHLALWLPLLSLRVVHGADDRPQALFTLLYPEPASESPRVLETLAHVLPQLATPQAEDIGWADVGARFSALAEDNESLPEALCARLAELLAQLSGSPLPALSVDQLPRSELGELLTRSLPAPSGALVTQTLMLPLEVEWHPEPVVTPVRTPVIPVQEPVAVVAAETFVPPAPIPEIAIAPLPVVTDDHRFQAMPEIEFDVTLSSRIELGPVLRPAAKPLPRFGRQALAQEVAPVVEAAVAPTLPGPVPFAHLEPAKPLPPKLAPAPEPAPAAPVAAEPVRPIQMGRDLWPELPDIQSASSFVPPVMEPIVTPPVEYKPATLTRIPPVRPTVRDASADEENFGFIASPLPAFTPPPSAPITAPLTARPLRPRPSGNLAFIPAPQAGAPASPHLSPLRSRPTLFRVGIALGTLAACGLVLSWIATHSNNPAPVPPPTAPSVSTIATAAAVPPLVAAPKPAPAPTPVVVEAPPPQVVEPEVQKAIDPPPAPEPAPSVPSPAAADLEKETVAKFRQAAETGNIEAAYLLAECLLLGKGCDVDEPAAVAWLRRAARSGDGRASDLLGVCYARGLGVRKSYDSALANFEQALKRGHAAAHVNIGGLHLNGWGVDRDPRVAVRHFTKGAEAGDVACMELLAQCFERGEGVRKDADMAKKWSARAAEVEQPTAAAVTVLTTPMP